MEMINHIYSQHNRNFICRDYGKKASNGNCKMRF